MGVYNVVAPCIVGGKHYVHPAEGVEIDDDEAGAFVKSGLLVAHEALEPVVDGAPLAEVVSDDEPEVDAEIRRRGRASR